MCVSQAILRLRLFAFGNHLGLRVNIFRASKAKPYIQLSQYICVYAPTPMKQFSSSSKQPVQPSSWLKSMDRWSEELIGLGLLVAAILLFTVGLGDVALRDWDRGPVLHCGGLSPSPAAD